MKRSVLILILVLSVWLQVPSAMAEMTMKQVDQVLQKEPNNIAALFQKARLLEQQNKLDEAIAIYQRIIKLEPTRPEAYNNLAAIYVKQGKLEEARKVLDKGMQTNDVYATMQQNLILINREMAARSYASAMVNVERKVELTQIDNIESGSSDGTGLLASAADEAQKRKQAEAERKRQAEELARQQEEERQRKLAEQKRQEELARKQEEGRQRKLAEQKRKEELARKQEEERQRQLAEQKRKEELARQKEEERRLARLEAEKQSAANKAQSPAEIKKEVTQRVMAWASAWSSQDALSYIGFYINGYQPNASTSHSDWVKQRKYRLRKPQWIKVKLENIQVDIINENTVTVRFLQHYRSNTYEDAGYKQLTLIKENGEWKIRDERVVKGQ